MDIDTRHTQAVQDYLKALYALEQEEARVSTKNLAERLGVSAAAATKMLKHLGKRKLVVHEPYAGARLTAAGMKGALEVIRHHRLLELYLSRMLGFEWSEVHAEAERLEHHISESLEKRIDDLLGHPEYDPHGEPIPTLEGHVTPPRGEPLQGFESGSSVMILRVEDRDAEALRIMDGMGLRPGMVITIVENVGGVADLTVRVRGVTHALQPAIARKVFVEEHQNQMETEHGNAGP